MPLLRIRNLPVPFKSLNQRDPSTTGLPGEIEEAINLQILRASADSAFQYERRPGLVEIADTQAGSGFRMCSYGGAVVAQTLIGVERMSAASARFELVPPAGSGVFLPPIAVGRNDVQVVTGVASGTQTPTQSYKDMALYQNTACYVWVDESGALQYMVRDGASNVVLASGALVASGASKSKIVILGTTFYVFWKEANAIKGATIGATRPFTASAATTVIAAASCLAGTDYDVQAGFDTTHIALMYREDATHHRRSLLSTAFAVTTSVNDATANHQPDMAMCWISQLDPAGSSSLLYGTLYSIAVFNVNIQTIDKATLAITSTFSQSASFTTVANMTGLDSNSGLGVPVLLIESVAAATAWRAITVLGSGVTSAMSFSLGLASRGFYLGGRGHVAVVYNSRQATGTVAAPQPTYFLAELSSLVHPNISGKWLPGIAGAYTSFEISSAPLDSAGVAHFLGAVVVGYDTATGTAVAQYGMTDLSAEYNSTKIGPALVFGGIEMMPGGVLNDLDGAVATSSALGIAVAVHEHGFHLKPEIPVLTEGAAASGSIPPGTRSVVIRYRWIDGASQKYVSAESTPVSITTVNANSSISVKMAGFNANTARPLVSMEVLRTPMGGDGSEYFRSSPPVFMATVFGSSETTFVDTADEATLAAGEPFSPFEAGGGPRPPLAPPAMNVIIEHKNRACGINAEDPRRIECSNEYSPGFSLTWTGVIVLLAPEPLYALASQDGHLIGFAKDCVYVWSGDLPDARGEGPTLPLAVKIPTGVGTDQPRSVVVTELGIAFYSSKKGFWLIDRSLQPQYIGAPVEVTAQGQTVSGATVHPTYTQVRWTTEGGTTFVMDTFLSKLGAGPVWTTFTGQACVHSIVHNGKWYLLTSDGKLLEEDLTRWEDGVALNGGAFVSGTPFTTRLHVSDINFAGVGGFVRVVRGHLLGEWYDSHKVKLTLTSDHRGTAGQVFSFDASTNPDPYELEFDPSAYQAKATSLDLIIEDTADYQTRGYAWTALMFEVGSKPGLKPTPVGRKMTGG